MSPEPSRQRSLRLLAIIALPALVIGLFAGWFWRSASPAQADRAAIEKVVHDYILEHPEILPQAMENLQKRESAKVLAGLRADLERPFPGAILGNPQGKVTLVEFTDFACGYCRQSAADVEELVRRNPDLKVVVREFPILSPASEDAARMGLAAAEQGKFARFHALMFVVGQPDAASIAAAAKQAGLDPVRAQAVIRSPRVELELQRNMELARQLGFNGTPSWVVGDEIISGAVGIERLAKAVAGARSAD